MIGIGTMELLLLACVGLPMFLGMIVVLAAALRYLSRPAPSQAQAASPLAVQSLSHQDVLRTKYFLTASGSAPHTCPRCHAPLTADVPEGLCPACLLAGGLQGDSLPPTSSGHGTPAGAGAVDAAALAEAFPNLEILELLGQGGMGTVYKVRQKNLDRLAALKVIPPQAALDQTFAERFAREARALARLNHSSIVTVYDFGQLGGFYFLLMEYIDGPNLRQLMRSERIAPREALAIVPQICDALQYAHDQGIVHRDIKPENVLLDRTGRVKIADFGLAKLLGTSPADFTLTHTQQVMGTPRYMAPEQIERPAEVDHRADIYSLGVVIYEMLTGELPIGRFAPPSQKVQVDVRLDEIVLRTLEKEPQRRYQQVSQVKTELASVASTPGQALPPSLAAAPDAKRSVLTPWEATAQFELAPMASPPLGMTLAVAFGMILGTLMLAAGLGLLVAGLYLCQTAGFDALLVLGGWGVGVLLGGAAAVFGCWNSYRKLPGAVDLVHAPHVTWFDYAMRVYILLGVGTLACGAMLLPTPQEGMSRLLLLFGGILTLQSIGVLVWRWSAQRHHTLGGASTTLRPSFTLAVVVPTLAIAAVWALVLLDFHFQTGHWRPRAVHAMGSGPEGNRLVLGALDNRPEGAQSALAVAAGISLAAIAALLTLWQLLGPRKMAAGGGLVVLPPLNHPAWPLAAAALGFAALLLPWSRLNLDSAVLEPDFQFTAARSVTFYGGTFLDASGMPGGVRYAATGATHVAGVAAAALLIVGGLAGAMLAGRQVPLAGNAVPVTLGLAVVLTIVLFGHQIGERAESLIFDSVTQQGIARTFGSDPANQSLARGMLLDYVNLRPAVGIYIAAIGAGLLVLIGTTQSVWHSGAPEAVAPVTPLAAAAASAKPLPADDREAIRQQVRGPATGLIVSGILGLVPPILLCLAIPLMWGVVSPVKSYEPRPPGRIGSTAIGPTAGAISMVQPPVLLAQGVSHADMPLRGMLVMIVVVALAVLLGLPASILLIIGGMKMRQLHSYGLVTFAAIIALLPLGPQWLISLPMGIWALAALGRPEVKEAFI